MTGNPAQAILTDQAWRSTLKNIHHALIPGGWFAFESRRPERQGWLDWDNPPPATAEAPGVGQVERHLELIAVELPLVSFRFTYRFPDNTMLRSESTVRFRTKDELSANLHDAGFTIHDVCDAPDRPGREFVFVAVRR